MAQKHHGLNKFQELVKDACRSGSPNEDFFGRLFPPDSNSIDRSKLGALLTV